MHDKTYVLKMLEDTKLGKYTNQLILYDIFNGSADLIEDKEVRAKIEETLISLVEKGIISASRGEEIVHKCLPMMLTEEQKKRRTNKHTNTNKKRATCNSPIGPFYDIYGTRHPVVLDFARMGRDWIERINKTSSEKISEMIYGTKDKDSTSKGQN
jgi:uncharacterized protein with NRDE domain